MRAGRLRHRLVFQVKTIPEAQDAFGAPKENWVDSFTVWGEFEPIGSKEFPAAQKRNSETTTRFRIRFRENIDPDKHRILFNAQTWNIFPPYAMPEGRRIETWIEATAII